MKIAVSAESTIDLNKELLGRFQINTTPFTVTLGDNSYLDGEITTDEIISFATKNKILPKTSAINKFNYDEHFDGLLKSHDAVIHFSLSSELSSACNNAIASAKERKNVYIIDTKSLSTGIALIAIYAKELIDKGEDIQTIYNKCLKRVPYIQASFALKRLDFLYKGGRCSALAFFGANLLKIRPQIIVKDGRMVSGKKYRGNYETVVKKYCDDVLEEFNTPDLNHVFITYTTASEQVIESVIEKLKDRGFKNIYVTRAGGTITSHCGEDCLGILYINDGNE